MKFEKNQYLYRLGDPSDAMFIIRFGKVSLYVDGNDGKIELATLGTGQIVGDLAFFTGGPRTAHAQAVTEVTCERVSYETVRQQFESGPTWVRTMTKTLAKQVKQYSIEKRKLIDPEDALVLPRLAVARGWGALTFISSQFGKREGKSLTIDWPTMRTYANVSFREISSSVLQLAKILESLKYCVIRSDNHDPIDLVFADPQILPDFLTYYVRALTKNSPELVKLDSVIFNTLQLLAKGGIAQTPIHRGQVEIDLVSFTYLAKASGHPEITATSVDRLAEYGLDIMKIATETSVKLRFHQEEIRNLAMCWKILRAIHQANQPKPLSAAG